MTVTTTVKRSDKEFVQVLCPLCKRRLLDRNRSIDLKPRVVTNLNEANDAMVIKCPKCGNLVGLNN